MLDLTGVPEAGLGWLDASGPDADVVLSTRVRLARNLQGRAFGQRASAQDAGTVLASLQSALPAVPMLNGAAVLELDQMETRVRQVLHERRVISRELMGPPEGPGPARAVVLASRHPLSVMLNEEDHLRIQSILSGLDLQQAWSLVDQLDDELGSEIPYAYHPEFGFLTSCPTNVGTGLRASVLVHLPALVLTKEIGRVLESLSQVGLTFRGLYGEGSEVVGNFFQISNQTTLGQTEEELIDHLQRMVEQVIHHEHHARQVLLRDAAQVTADKLWRAYGLLRHARALSFEELMNLLSGVRLGASLKLLPGLRVYTLNKIMIFTQTAHLEEAAGRELSPSEREAHRAAFVRSVLRSEGVSAEDV